MTNGAGWGSKISSLHLIISVLSMIRVYRFVHINTVLHSHTQTCSYIMPFLPENHSDDDDDVRASNFISLVSDACR